MGQPFYVYMLKCSDGSYYIGHTDNLERRLFEHKEGIRQCYTYFRRPVELVFYEETYDRTYAIEFEYKIKHWSRKKKEALIEKNWQKISSLGKKKFD